MTGTAVKVLVVGDYPPPYGGISVAVSMLRRRLDATPGFACRVLDIGASRRRRRAACLPARNAGEVAWQLISHAAGGWIIHLQTNGHNRKSWTLALACAMAGVANGHRTVVTLGSGQLPAYLRAARGPTRVVSRAALGTAGAVVCMNERARAAVLDCGVPEGKVHVLANFYGVTPAEIGRVPERVDEFMRRHRPVVGVIASTGPEYGVPLFVEAAARLGLRAPSLGVLLIGPEGVEPHDLGDHLLVTGSLPHDAVLGVMQRLSLFVRPTLFDGDAASVHEALALGVPVVASDTDFRPQEVLLFRRGDAADLAAKMEVVLGDRHGAANRARSAIDDATEPLLALYRRLAARSREARR